jgi:FixJ family two-component response regulator
LAEQNAKLPEDWRMAFRIGVNLDDLIAEGHTIRGDGVNIAARPEKLVERGSVASGAMSTIGSKASSIMRIMTSGGGGMKEASTPQPVVFVIDDDASIREALKSLFNSIGLRVETFGSASQLLERPLPDAPSCLVLDVRLPGLSGLDFQGELAKANILIPIIFITGHGDIPMSVRAMKAGAVEFLTKPFRDQDLLDAVQTAIERDRTRREGARSISGLRSRFEILTPREQEVIAFVTTGMMNKQIAAQIGVSEITVKVHRGNIMRKMGAKSLADLVRMADVLGIRREKP